MSMQPLMDTIYPENQRIWSWKHPAMSAPVVLCVILTDQVAYEVNVQNMMKVDEVKDQFLDGAPADFKIAAMREKGSQQSQLWRRFCFLYRD